MSWPGTTGHRKATVIYFDDIDTDDIDPDALDYFDDIDDDTRAAEYALDAVAAVDGFDRGGFDPDTLDY